MATNAYPRQAAGATSDLDFRRWAGPITGNGVIPYVTNSYEVFGDSSGRQVKVRPGRAYIKGLVFPLETQLTVPLDAGTGQPRIDAIILRLTASGSPTGDPIVKKGTPSASPVAPTITQTDDGTFELLLATVAVPSAASYVVSPAMVTDSRTFTRLGDTQQTVRIRSTRELSLGSTEHGFQIGDSTGPNLAADLNEIQARNDGLAAGLGINRDGGDIGLGNDDSTVVIYGRLNNPSLPWAMAAGLATMPTTAAGATSTRVVTLPAGRFTDTPLIQLTMHSTNPKLRSVGIGDRSATSFEIKFSNEGDSSSALNVAWTAIQMSSGSASG